ncbi:MAG: RNA polymerase sigma factor [Bacteroidales bacterium]|nr:RNA polymerase sigma factor [Bacteroidales bacterium]
MTREETISLYREHSRRLYNSSLRIVGSPEVAEELMHDALLKFIRGGVVCQSREQESAWLTRTCIRLSVDWIRKKKREAVFLEDYAGSMQESEEDFLFEDRLVEDVARVKDAILSLPAPYCLILNLVLLEGLDYSEISSLLGVREVTLRSQFSRGKVKLVEMLERK